MRSLQTRIDKPTCIYTPLAASTLALYHSALHPPSHHLPLSPFASQTYTNRLHEGSIKAVLGFILTSSSQNITRPSLESCDLDVPPPHLLVLFSSSSLCFVICSFLANSLLFLLPCFLSSSTSLCPSFLFLLYFLASFLLFSMLPSHFSGNPPFLTSLFNCLSSSFTLLSPSQMPSLALHFLLCSMPVNYFVFPD